ncbi:GNAT family N-acetyltransferase [Candidatus Bipolaricaulota bacterium]|nr:GNAT family N-acetyltransferase [Candidatus Bipolaricaulota bacterium]
MTQSKITIREARKEDFAVIQEIALDSMPHRVSVSPIREEEKAEENMRKFYANLVSNGLAMFPPEFEAAAFVAIDKDERPIGYVLVATSAKDDLTGERQAYILDIVVRPDRRGQGIGTKLMEKAHEYAREKGLRYIGLTVASGNESALNLYRKLGYIEEWKRMARRL